MRRLVGGLACLLMACGPLAGPIRSIPHAIRSLDPSDRGDEAKAYLEARPKEAVPALMKYLRKQKGQGSDWVCALWTLTEIPDPRVVPFLIEELRAHFRDPRVVDMGCIRMEWPSFYGGSLAEKLGSLGDHRAIPVLREALVKGDFEVQRHAYGALFKLGAQSLDELFALARSADAPGYMGQVLDRLGWERIQPDPEGAVALFDRIIRELPRERFPYEVACAHFQQIQCFERMKRFGDALKACEAVLSFQPAYENLNAQVRTRMPGIRLAHAGSRL